MSLSNDLTTTDAPQSPQVNRKETPQSSGSFTALTPLLTASYGFGAKTFEEWNRKRQAYLKNHGTENF